MCIHKTALTTFNLERVIRRYIDDFDLSFKCARRFLFFGVTAVVVTRRGGGGNKDGGGGGGNKTVVVVVVAVVVVVVVVVVTRLGPKSAQPCPQLPAGDACTLAS